MQLIHDEFSALRKEAAALVAAPTAPVRHGLGSGVTRDADGIWAPTDPWGYVGADTLKRPMEQHATVYKAVTQIARNFSSVKLEFFEGNSDQALPPTHPIPRLFASPERRAGLRGRQWIAKHAQDMDLSGDWFVIFDEIARMDVRSASMPTKMLRVPRSAMKPDIDQATGEFVGWIYRQRERLSPEQVMHAMYPSPYDDFLGLAPLVAAFLEADQDYQAALWNRYVFESGSPGVVFTRQPGTYSDRNKDKKFEEDFADRNQGPRRVGKAAVLPPGMELKELAANQRDMSFVDLRRFSREQILAIFDVPPAVAGVFEYANYANSREQLRYFWYHKLFPMMDEFESVVQTDLLDRFNTGIRCAFKREDIQGLIEDFGQKLEAAKELWGMGVPFEAINARLDLGFDTATFPGADTGFLPFAVTPVERVLEEPEAPGFPPAGDDGETMRYKGRRVEHGSRTSRWQHYMRITDKAERRVLGDWRYVLGLMRDEILDRARQAFPAGNAVTAKVIRHADDGSRLIPDPGALTDKATRKLKRSQIQAAKQAAESVAVDLSIALDFDLFESFVLTLLEERTVAIKSAVENAGERFRRAIAPGIEAGESIDKLEARIQESYAEAYKGQARTVARTETLSVFNATRETAFAQAGVKVREWLTARDGAVRDTHVGLDGQKRPTGVAFSNGLKFPHEFGAPAGEVINCRCVLVPVVEEDES